MSTAEELGQQADAKFVELQGLMTDVKAAVEAGDQRDRIDNLSQKADELGAEVATLKQAKMDAEAKEADAARIARLEAMVGELAKDVRSPSKADAILGERSDESGEPATDSFFRYLALAQNPKTPTEVKQRAEKALLDMGSRYVSIDEVEANIAANGGVYGKATLGDTNATGGYLAPRAVVAELTSVAVANNPYRSMLTVVPGIVGPTIEIPHIGLVPTRAQVVGRGETKPNVGVAFSAYTATFYTLAQIHDAANQWLRQTRGRGEQIIRQRLGEAMALGESHYVLNGTGTNEPKGLLTSIGTSGTFVTSHTAAQTTIAGNIATGLAKANGDLAQRSRRATAAVMNAKDFWIVLASGADAAGFYINPMGGAAEVNAVGAFSNGAAAIRIWGEPLFADPNMPEDSLVTGDFQAAELYLGDGYRVDTSTEAGDRWDKNLTGFRAEEEIAFNADPYVAAGHFQRLIDTKA